MIVVKTFNEEIVKQEIDPAHLKQFKRAGWVELQETKKVESVKEPETTVNKGGRPKKTI